MTVIDHLFMQLWLTFAEDPTGEVIDRRVQVMVEYAEDMLTVKVLKHLLNVRRLLGKEINDFLDSMTAKEEDRDLENQRGKNKGKLVHTRAHVLLQGIHLTFMSSNSAMAVDSGAVSMSYEQLGKATPKWLVHFDQMSARIIEPEKIVWSETRLPNGRFSDMSKCFLWADVQTNMFIQNYHDCPTQRSGQVEFANKIYATIVDTRAILRPGAISQALYLHSHFAAAVEEFQRELAREEATNAEQKLMHSATEYMDFMTKHLTLQMEESSTSGSVSIGTAVLLRVLNTWICLPIADTPFAMCARERPAAFHVVIDQIIGKMVSKTITERLSEKEASETVGHKRQKMEQEMTTSQLLGSIRLLKIKSFFSETRGASECRVRPTTSEYRRSPNRASINTIVLEADSRSRKNASSLLFHVRVHPPKVGLDGSILPLLLDMSQDWRDPYVTMPAMKVESDLLEQSALTDKMAKTASKFSRSTGRSGDRGDAAPPTNAMRAEGKIRIDSGQLVIKSTFSTKSLQGMPMFSSLRGGGGSAPTKASRLNAGNVDKEGVTTLFSAKLPEITSTVRYSQIPQVSLGTGSDCDAVKRHDEDPDVFAHVEVGMQNMEMTPLFLLFVQEGKAKLRQRSAERIRSLEKRKVQEKQEADLSWTKAMTAAKFIQRTYRGHRFRRLIRSLQTSQQEGGVSFHPMLKHPGKPKQLFCALVRLTPFVFSLVCAPVADSDVKLRFGIPKSMDILVSSSDTRSLSSMSYTATIPESVIRVWDTLNHHLFSVHFLCAITTLSSISLHISLPFVCVISCTNLHLLRIASVFMGMM
jgi:hypothetical protein